MPGWVNGAVLSLLCVTAVAMALTRNLFAMVLLMGCYSFLLAILWSLWAAPDVSFTEAVVGSGIATILFLALLWMMPHRLPPAPRSRWRPADLATLLILASVSGWFLLGLPSWGDPLAPAQTHVAPFYLAQSEVLTRTTNVVTATLADFRGFDTLIETTVIFAAGVACWLLGDSRS